ncbi:MAG TPA: hypothetical protein VF743_06160 [Acidimicrobiales bacterium]
MRRTLAGIVAAGVLLVGAACSDGDDDDTATGDGDGDNGGGSTEQFCEEYRGYDEQFSGGQGSEEEVLAAVRSLDPPEEIADDFDKLIEGLDTLSTLDTSNPEAVADMQEQMADYQEATTNIETFINEECGVDTGADSTGGSVATDDTTTAG